MFEVSISIVVYCPELNVFDVLCQKLKIACDLARKEVEVNFSLIVVDNTTDNSCQEGLVKTLNKHFSSDALLAFEMLKTEENLGFGYGHNLAAKKTGAKYHLILNPDVFVNENTLLEAVKYMENHEEVGLLVPDVYGEDGKRHYLCKKNPTLFDMFLRGGAPKFVCRIFAKRMRLFEMRDRDYDAEMLDVSYCTGCFMFMRNAVLKLIGGFDTHFFLYLEDADLSRRVLNVSRTAYVPMVRIVHKWAKGAHCNWKLRWISIKSAFIYWWKWGGLF